MDRDIQVVSVLNLMSEMFQRQCPHTFGQIASIVKNVWT